MANPGSGGPPGDTLRLWPATILQFRAQRAVKKPERWAQLSREAPNLVMRLRQRDDGKWAWETAAGGSPAKTCPDADAMFADLLPQDLA